MLSIQSIFVNYDEKEILHGVSFEVEPGQVVALIGPNGAGKTTLIRAVSGILPLRSGAIKVLGDDLASMTITERARMLAVVPQARKLPAAYSVQQAVLMGRTPYLSWMGNPGPKDFEKTEWALERTHIADLADRRVEELSGGEQQLVLVARALAQDAPIILLDEPTAHLDLQHQATILNLVRELAEERNLAVLMSLHDLNLVSIYSDRIALLGDGQLRALGSPNEVLNQKELSQVYQVSLHILPHPYLNIPLVILNGDGDDGPEEWER